jgi:ribosomal protein L31
MSGIQIGVFLTLATIIGTVVASITQIFTVRSTTRKIGAEAVNIDVSSAKHVADMAVELIQPYKETVKDLQDQLQTARDQAKDLNQRLGEALTELDVARRELAAERGKRNESGFQSQ